MAGKLVVNQERRKRPEARMPKQLERRRSGARLASGRRKDRLKSYVDNHRKVAEESLRRMLAAPLASLMTWAVIAIALTLPVGLYVFLQNAQQLSQGWNDAAQISVYLKLEVSEVRGRELAQNIESRADVQQVRYISRDEALEEFQQLSGFGDALQYLNENPLPAVIIVSPHAQEGNLISTEHLLSQLKAMSGVDQAQLDLKWVERLYSLMALGQRVALTLGILLGLAVLLVVGNTIRLAIESRRAEIVVVKLVGGTDAFVRRPFLYTGVWYGLGGGLIAWALINLMMFWLSGPVGKLVSAYNSDFDLAALGFGSTLLLWLLSALLGLFGAWLAVAQHLRDIEPR